MAFSPLGFFVPAFPTALGSILHKSQPVILYQFWVILKNQYF